MRKSDVTFSGYTRLWADRRIRALFVSAFFARIPNMAIPLVLALLVVEKLDGTYAQAGIVAAAETIGAAIGAPWRGWLIDRLGLRRALIPSIVAVSLIYPAAAFASYAWLVPLAFLAGLFLIPIFTVVRLALAVMVEEEHRHVAFAADAIVAEASFLVGPAAGALLATQASPSVAIATVGVCEMLSGLMIYWLNPPLRSILDPGLPAIASSRRWLTAPVLSVFVLSAGTTAALMGTDLAIIAELRELDAVDSIWLVFLFWGVSSLLGGVLYGAHPATIRPTHLLLALGLLTIPVGLGATVWSLSLWVVPAGLLCAPAMTAATEAITRLVPETRRGEAMGWQGTAYTLGAAASAPLIGSSIDDVGAWGGFVVGGAIATVVALASYGGQRVRRHGTERMPQPVR